MNLFLNHEGFENYLVFRKEDSNTYEQRGVRYLFSFPNGYGASVVKCPGSYGWHADLWELAVLYSGEITYNTPITSDVVPSLTDEDVRDLLSKIMDLKED